MDFVQASILGIVEGLTEFLPVSSTFHLIWVAKILHIAQTDFVKLFEVFIQAGAILAVVIVYWKAVKDDKHILKKTAVAFIPTAIVGFLLYKIIKTVFFNSDVLMLSVFINIGLCFVFIESFFRQKGFKLFRHLGSIRYKDALIIGLFQSLAVIPGVSRAGAVIVIMLFMGFRREEAAKFSFFLAVPTILGAAGLDFIKTTTVVSLSLNTMLLLLVGTFTAFASAYVVVKWFIKYLQTHTLTVFGWYRIIAGVFLLIFNIK